MLTWSLNTYATIYQVGATKIYPSPNALYLANVVEDGDTIEIDGGIYSGQSSLAVWQKDDLLIKGVGGRPHLVAEGQYIFGKGIWVVAGDNNTVENIEFSGATVPDKNGAGIRLDGNEIIVRHCYFHDNENGILTNNTFAGEILIEYSEFGNNGFGDGLSHNLYVGRVDKLIFRFNYSHHAEIGHNLKSRAEENYILYNRIMDEASGISSRLIDLPNGGFSIVMGNLLMQGENATNNNLLGYGLEGLINTTPHELYVVNNTFVNKRMASCIFISIEDGTTMANVSNNIFTGTGTILNGTTTAMDGNYINENIASLGFVNELAYDYHLLASSPAIDYGIAVNPVGANSLTPASSYEHPTSFSERNIVDNSIDAGAYEFGPLVAIADLVTEALLVFPNPASNEITIGMAADQINNLLVFDNLGRIVWSDSNTNKLNLSSLPIGTYFLKIIARSGTARCVKIIKQQ